MFWATLIAAGRREKIGQTSQFVAHFVARFSNFLAQLYDRCFPALLRETPIKPRPQKNFGHGEMIGVSRNEAGKHLSDLGHKNISEIAIW